MYFKNFPKTTFTLPSGYTVSAVNILKTFVISETTKSNTEILNKTNGVYTNKIENLNYEFYGNKLGSAGKIILSSLRYLGLT